MFSHLLPFGAGWSRRELFNREEKIFFIFILIATVTEFVTFLMALKKVNNLWVLHVHHLLEYGLLMLILAGWQRRPAFRRIALSSILLYSLFWIVALCTVERFSGPATYTHNTAGVLLVIASSATLFDLMKDDQIDLHRDFRFWVTAGVLICYGGNSVLFLLFDRITLLRFQDAAAVWTIHWVIDTIVNLVYAAAFLCLRRP
jgi:hypothetical protein